MLKSTVKTTRTVKFCLAASKQSTSKTLPSISTLPLLLCLKTSPENFRSRLYFKSGHTFCSNDTPKKPKDSQAHESNNEDQASPKEPSKIEEEQEATQNFYKHYNINEASSSEAKLLLEYISKGVEIQAATDDLKELYPLHQDLFDLDKGIDARYISKDLQDRIASSLDGQKFVFFPTEAITQVIFTEFIGQKRRLYFTGPSAVGKSCSLALLAIVLRTDLSQRVLFVHDTKGFVSNPLRRIVSELLTTFEYDFSDPKNTEAQEFKEEVLNLYHHTQNSNFIDDTLDSCLVSMENYLLKRKLKLHFILDQHNDLSKMVEKNDERALQSGRIFAMLEGSAISLGGKVVIAAFPNDEGAPKWNDEFYSVINLKDTIKSEERQKYAKLVFKDTNMEEVVVNAILEAAGRSLGEIQKVAQQKVRDAQDKLTSYMYFRTQEIRDDIINNFIFLKEEKGYSKKQIYEAVNEIFVHPGATPPYNLIDTRYIVWNNSQWEFLCKPARQAWLGIIREKLDPITDRFDEALKERSQNPLKFSWELLEYFRGTISELEGLNITLPSQVFRQGRLCNEDINLSFDKLVDLKLYPLRLYNQDSSLRMLLVPVVSNFPILDFVNLNKAEDSAVLIQVRSVLKDEHIESIEDYLNDTDTTELKQGAKFTKREFDELLGVKKQSFMVIYIDTDLDLEALKRHENIHFVQFKNLPRELFRFNSDLLLNSRNDKIYFTERRIKNRREGISI